MPGSHTAVLSPYVTGGIVESWSSPIDRKTKFLKRAWIFWAILAAVPIAVILTAIGVLMVHAGRWFGRVRVPDRIVGLLPVGSSLVVTALGLVLLAEALGQVGVHIF